MPIIFANVIQSAFSPLIGMFESILVFIHAHIVGSSWGLAIVGLTILIRLVLMPLTFKQFHSMQKMQLLAPEIKALQAKYKDDKQRQQQEVMKFYQASGVNPLAACLPMVLQLPVFISLFYMLRTDLKLDICGAAMRQHFGVLHNSQISSSKLANIGCNTVAPHSAKFLFLPDITQKATGVALVTLLVVYVGSQLLSTMMATASADPNQRRMMLLLPLVFVVILYRYPAGLLVYWITTNLWTIVQQYYIRRRLGPSLASGAKPPGSSSDGPTAGPSAGPKSPDSSSGGQRGRSLEPALAGASSKGGTRATPPPPPRKKKKQRSGRRR